MALAADIMLGGFSPGSARAVGGQVQTAISAAGTVITDATDLTRSINVVSTVAASSGVQLPMMNVGESMIVYNGGANTLRVYPGSTSIAINQITAGSAHQLAVTTAAQYHQVSSTQIVAFQSA